MKTIINKILLFVMLFAGAASLHGCSDPSGITERENRKVFPFLFYINKLQALRA